MGSLTRSGVSRACAPFISSQVKKISSVGADGSETAARLSPKVPRPPTFPAVPGQKLWEERNGSGSSISVSSLLYAVSKVKEKPVLLDYVD